ncbi:MAG TPA: tyrosine-type recombinase/integrase [Ruminiclostridium sp.]
MNYVDPIRSTKKIHELEEYLKKQCIRNMIMFQCGIYTGLRISDILKFKVADFKDKDSITLREKKTGKKRTFEINPILKKSVEDYIVNMEPEDYLIKSRQGFNKAISAAMAWVILRDAGKEVGIENLGTHSMRKTFGFHYYQKDKDIETLKEIFNHNDSSITKRYIGITQDTVNFAIKNLTY